MDDIQKHARRATSSPHIKTNTKNKCKLGFNTTTLTNLMKRAIEKSCLKTKLKIQPKNKVSSILTALESLILRKKRKLKPEEKKNGKNQKHLQAQYIQKGKTI